HTPKDRLERARRFWRNLGCRLIELPPDEHDRALALTSHLPHVAAAALATTSPSDSLSMAGGAYRVCTRVAGADADLWARSFRANRESVLSALDTFQA